MSSTIDPIAHPVSDSKVRQCSRIAFFLYSFDGGGAERVILHLAMNFAQKGFTVDVILIKAKGAYLSQVPSTVRVLDLGTSTAASLAPLIRYLRQEQPTALISTMHYANEVALWARWWAKQLFGVNTQVLVTEQNTLSRYAQRSSRQVEKWTPLWAKLFYPWADRIIAASQGVAQDLQQVTQLSGDRIQVIYNPIITPDLLGKAKQPLDHPWFLSGQPPVILGIGRLVSQKDFSTLIRAFARVRQVRPARLMILGGNGGNRPTLEALIQQLHVEPDVEFPGFVDNPYAYLAQSAVFALTSQWEGFGNVVAEALAVGTPVVATHCESGPAEILKNGQYGTLVPVGDDQAVAAAILDLLSGKVKSVDPNWLTQFEVEAIAQQYLAALGL
ncbi:MAG: glycosyltransferase [Oculatellaceae cyanobacterium Prado106]|nr:glycosyltransferase [Oculatellaceae cyanobacterium Prado106]